MRLAREREVRGGAPRLLLQAAERRLGSGRRHALLLRSRATCGPLALLVRDVDTGTPRLRQTDGDGLLGALRAVLALADVVDLLADELARLRARRLALALVAAGTFEGGFFRHGASSCRCLQGGPTSLRTVPR